ncbi:acetyl-CoA carboxylase biotin carboxyl carrier protein subunit [Thermophagus xiamenensis]|jgi:biotin carboxyl carrier protein|uniref:Biotin carboxyl carrier protein n=1 Tax=Thermophagus xiamenensis TaxID=385682 RepID=A0A1I2B226_9BACT|nr:acetyl-CoA carboxylase biotin carboxyl carrier protein subunit [Thermophagus xiamenensis]SFE49958.1 biotin carboxyl carrier protein [Thermophagus xiamenensis]
MKTLAKNGNRQEEIKVLNRDGSLLTVAIGEREYTLDIEKVENGVYSVLHKGKSHNMEIIKNGNKNHYTVNTQYKSFDIEIAPATPAANRTAKNGKLIEKIKAPIPGKIVSVKVKIGDLVEANQTLIVLSAMKMENELKSPIKGVVKDVTVKKDDVVRENFVLVEVKALD